MAERFEPVAPPTDDDEEKPLLRRLLWFAVFAFASLVAVAGAAYLLRTLLFLG